jgi:hypothetical protein
MRVRVVSILLATVSLAVAAEPAGPAMPAGEETRRAVIALLRANRQKYGDDAAIMQGLLLVHATQGGAILATEVSIGGFESRDDRRYVTFRVDSGAILDDSTMDREQRLEHIWRSILERTLARYPTFSVPGDGIAVEIRYSHRPYESISELYRTIENVGESERAKFYLLNEHVTAFIEHRLDAQALLARSLVFLDEAPVTVRLHDFVGPPAPIATPVSIDRDTAAY